MQLSAKQKRFQQIKARERASAIAKANLQGKVNELLLVNPTLDPHTALQIARKQLNK